MRGHVLGRKVFLFYVSLNVATGMFVMYWKTWRQRRPGRERVGIWNVESIVLAGGHYYMASYRRRRLMKMSWQDVRNSI